MDYKKDDAFELEDTTQIEDRGLANNVSLPSWRYKIRKFVPCSFASSSTQLVLAAVVCFCCPGISSSLNGLGGGGQVDPKASNDSNTALYSIFAVAGFFAGPAVNRLGTRFSLVSGGFGYGLYISVFLCYNHTRNYGFIVFAGACLGFCAALIWAAAGAVMMTYPQEDTKGRYISCFWMIFNAGGVVGSLIPFAQNISSNGNTTVNDGTYVIYLVLSFVGSCIAIFTMNAENVVRPNGSRIIMPQQPTWKTELAGLCHTLAKETYILSMFPLFLSANWFYTYQFNDVNLARFTTRTRALNDILYWTAQVIGAYGFGLLLDWPRFRRVVRARAAWLLLLLLTVGVWGGGYAFQRQYTRSSIADGSTHRLDWTSKGYLEPMFLYLSYGFFNAAWQTCAYWFMSSLTNDARTLTNFSGFYKGISAAGSAITWRLNGLEVSYMTNFATSWGVLMAGLVFALPVVWFGIRDTAVTSATEDLSSYVGGVTKEELEV